MKVCSLSFTMIHTFFSLVPPSPGGGPVARSGSLIPDRGSLIVDQGSPIDDQGSSIGDQGSRIDDERRSNPGLPEQPGYVGET
jgi:hypothetical protein